MVPTLVVTVFRLFTEDPIRIYQLVCGLSFSALTVASFLSGRFLGNVWTGHLAALAAATCPAITTYLVHHIHSYSHVVTLAFFGPALHVSLALIMADPAGPGPKFRSHLVAGLLWGLAYLCRSEMLLFFAVFVIALAWRRRSRPGWFRPLLGAIGMFQLLFGTYNVYAEAVTSRDGILIRKTI